jgi:hypothetical protein
MAEEKEKFLSRWSRLKSESKELPEPKDDSPAPVLPEVDKLTSDSDFTGFMHPKVQDALRRVALKKLFSDPHFNVADPYEAYSGDWTGGEPISEELLAQLNQARTLIFDDKGKKAEAPQGADARAAEVADAGAAEAEQPQLENHEPGRKDT